MLDKIDHVGIAVNNLTEIRKTVSKAFGLEPSYEEVVADQNVKIMGYTVGDSKIEYFEPTSSNSPIAKFLEKKGNGLHHIAFQVKNLDQKLEELKTANFILIDEKPRTGASGKKIAFLHPKEFNGILIELCES
jgi:methylmalonyl-CoA epimerase